MKESLTFEKIKLLPKIELHCHLDGSLRVESVLEEFLKLDIETQNKYFPNSMPNIDSFDKLLRVGKSCNSLIEYLEKFDLPLEVMQTEEAIERFTFEVFEDAYVENTKYLELRFASVLHTRRGLSEKTVISAAIRGMEKAKRIYDIEGNLIICCMKHLPEESAIKTIESAKEFLNKGVVAVDLAGGENEGFYKKFENAFNLAKKYNFNITIHAGEAASGKNILDSIIYLHADRIGHGTRLYDNYEAYELVKNNGILLEVCPTSNLQTRAVLEESKHPFIKYFNDGIKICINTDNRTVSNVTLSEEYFYAGKLLGMNIDEYKIMYYNTIEASFADDEVKKILKSKIDI